MWCERQKNIIDMLIFRYPVSKCKISKYLDLSRYLLGHFSIASVQFSSFLCWMQSFDSDKSYLRMFSLHVQIDKSISFWLMCYCLVVSRPWASFSLMKDFFSSMTSFAYTDDREIIHVWDVGKDLYCIDSNPCLIFILLTISEKENLPFASFLAIPFLRGSFLWAKASDYWIVDWSNPEFTTVLWVVYNDLMIKSKTKITLITWSH